MRYLCVYIYIYIVWQCLFLLIVCNHWFLGPCHGIILWVGPNGVRASELCTKAPPKSMSRKLDFERLWTSLKNEKGQPSGKCNMLINSHFFGISGSNIVVWAHQPPLKHRKEKVKVCSSPKSLQKNAPPNQKNSGLLRRQLFVVPLASAASASRRGVWQQQLRHFGGVALQEPSPEATHLALAPELSRERTGGRFRFGVFWGLSQLFFWGGEGGDGGEFGQQNHAKPFLLFLIFNVGVRLLGRISEHF